MNQSKVQFFKEILSQSNYYLLTVMNRPTTLHFAVSADDVDAPQSARPFALAASQRFAAVLGATLLVACGGGGADTGATGDSLSLAKTTTVFKPVVTPPATPAPSGDAVATPLPATVGASITDVKIQNTGAAQTNVPFTFGQIVAPGQMNAKEGLIAKLGDGTMIRLQSDIKATHDDGSVRHMIVSGVLPALASGATQTLSLAKSAASERSMESLQTLASAGLSGKVTITIDGAQYTASLADALADTTPETWLAGQVANEWLLDAPLKNAAGVAHPLLTTRFYVRWYSGLSKQARIDVVVENIKTFTAGARNLTYDVNVDIAGRTVYSKNALTHYHHARWHKAVWWDAAREPAINVRHNSTYLMASKAVSNYDSTIVPSEEALALLGKDVTGPMTIGPLQAYMPTTGGRADIGPLPSWSVLYLLSMDKRARDTMMTAADASGSWSIHYRDEKTGYPVRTDNEANARISTHGNMYGQGPLPVPRCANSNASLCATPYSEDTAHQPSLAYLPYLVTGDYYYLEELQFWAASNPLGTDPGYNGNGQGLLRWQQVRGQAWSLRTLGHSAYITPDSHPLKSYFNKQLDNNLEFYHATYVVGNPNNLGAYDGSGRDSFWAEGSSLWQDDFFTWSFGYLSELGFSKATPILKWKAQYPVGRLTAPGFCWIMGSNYNLNFRNSATNKIHDSFASLYAANFGNDIYNDNGQFFSHPKGLKYIEQECGSQAQADYFSAANGFTWPVGRMVGYSDSTMGYPANMQPAVAVAATSGIPNATQAWTRFANRAAKPDYRHGPQWAIVPR